MLQVWPGEQPGDAGAKPLAQVPLTLSAFGTAASAYTLPPDAPPGPLTLSLAEQPAAAATLRIVETIPSEAQLSLAPDRQVVFPGKVVTIAASARADDGTPSVGMDLDWRLLASPEPDLLPGGYQGGLVDWSRLGSAGEQGSQPNWTELAAGTKETGPDGTAQMQGFR